MTTTTTTIPLQDDDSFERHNYDLRQTDRGDLIEAAYYRDGDDLANQICWLDEELSGVRPATASADELIQRLDNLLLLAAKRWIV